MLYQIREYFDYSSCHILNYCFSIGLMIFFLRGVTQKSQHLASFYFSIVEYHHGIRNSRALILSSLLLSIEYILCILLIVPYLKHFTSLLICGVQIYYLYLMINNYDKTSESNCGCYSNLPRKVDFRSLMVSGTVLLVSVMNMLIER